MNYDGFEVVHPEAHSLARANVVLAALSTLTGSLCDGTVRSDERFVPNVAEDRLALLEAVTAMQTELLFSLSVADPLMSEAVDTLAPRLQTALERHPNSIDTLDAMVQSWMKLLDGKGPKLKELAYRLSEEGHLELRQISEALG